MPSKVSETVLPLKKISVVHFIPKRINPLALTKILN